MKSRNEIRKEFFELFGVDAVTQATFEHRVKFPDGSQGFVDCFWQGRILVENNLEMITSRRSTTSGPRSKTSASRSSPSPSSSPQRRRSLRNCHEHS